MLDAETFYEPSKPWQRAIAYLICLLLAAVFVWTALEQPFTPASDLGYYLGMSGGLMMLSLLIYPLRKYWSLLNKFGSMRAWFFIHIAFGICGPVLVLLHSTFQLRSFNAAVAFWSMIAVTLSGLAGRFVFTQVDHELNQRQGAQRDAEQALIKRPGGGTPILDYAPDVHAWLEAYKDAIYSVKFYRLQRLYRLAAAYWQKRQLARRCQRELAHAIAEIAKSQKWPAPKALVETQIAQELVVNYINSIDRAARFIVVTKVLSWWHILHVPVVYILTLSAVAHVVAVHMY